MFKPLELQVPINRLGSVDGKPFELGLGNILIQELGSFVEGSKNPTTQTSTPKSMDEVVEEVMQADKEAKLFQTMAIVSLNMGNLNLEVNSLKNKLDTKEKEKVILQVELDKRGTSKRNISITQKSRGRIRQRMSKRSKHSYKNCMMKIRNSKLRQF